MSDFKRTKTQICLITSIRSKIENRWIKTVHLSSEKRKVHFSLHHGRECNSVGKKKVLDQAKMMNRKFKKRREGGVGSAAKKSTVKHQRPKMKTARLKNLW